MALRLIRRLRQFDVPPGGKASDGQSGRVELHATLQKEECKCGQFWRAVAGLYRLEEGLCYLCTHLSEASDRDGALELLQQAQGKLGCCRRLHAQEKQLC